MFCAEKILGNVCSVAKAEVGSKSTPRQLDLRPGYLLRKSKTAWHSNLDPRGWGHA